MVAEIEVADFMADLSLVMFNFSENQLPHHMCPWPDFLVYIRHYGFEALEGLTVNWYK